MSKRKYTIDDYVYFKKLAFNAPYTGNFGAFDDVSTMPAPIAPTMGYNVIPSKILPILGGGLFGAGLLAGKLLFRR